jgi:phytoene synthase
MSDGSVSLAEAYSICRGIARREAKNFYYAFRVLPKAKSDAMCAVYAFMRRADDIADEESMGLEQRRVAMAEWLGAWRTARAGGATSDPVFLALNDTQQRFGIPDTLLEELVQGTTMDLEEELPGVTRVTLPSGATLQVYESFEDLYRYCYLVASVVGMVCIRIFGYSDPAAEKLAERTGIAFQLTNILRDVKEDAERGRIYLPQRLLAEFGATPEDVLALAGGTALRAKDRAMLSALSVQAWQYYKAGWELLPLIEQDSQAALWVMVEIYSRLLREIDARHGDVFSKRVSVPSTRKMFVLVRGAAMAVRERRR